MEKSTSNPFRQVVSALRESRYVLVGGFAAVMHGNNRFTPDVNIVIDFEPASVLPVLSHLQAVGLEAEPGLDLTRICEAETRAQWSRGDPFKFLSLKNPEIPAFSVELFLQHPQPNDLLMGEAVEQGLGESLTAAVCPIDRLIQMKQLAGRPQDLTDLENLDLICKLRDGVLRVDADQPDVIGEAELSDAQRERVLDLAVFGRLSGAERVKWLGDMLEALGGFWGA